MTTGNDGYSALSTDPKGLGEPLGSILGDSPFTAIAVARLLRGQARAYVQGELSHFRAAVVQTDDAPEEPTGHGADAAALWELLRGVPGWTCVEVADELAPALGELMAQELGVAVRYYGDLHYALQRPALLWPHPAVRLLAPDDAPLLEAAPPELRGGGLRLLGARALLAEGYVAAGIVDGRVVATAQLSARGPRYADIGVHTLEPYRRRGLCAAAASLVAQAAQAEALTPVWSTGEDNRASQAAARKVGFSYVGRMTYVIPQQS